MVELPDDLQPLAEISEEDWGLIEHLAALAERRGNVLKAGAIEAERARQMLEMGSDAILNLVQHLAVFRRSDLIQALEIADDLYSLTNAILKRSAEQLLRINPDAIWAPDALAKRWERAQRKPAAAMRWIRLQAARMQDASDEERAAIQSAMLTCLGLDARAPLAMVEPLLRERQEWLIQLADPLHRKAAAWNGGAGDPEDVEEVLAAYSGAGALLADARAAGGWQALGDGLGVAAASLIAAYLLLAGIRARPPGPPVSAGTPSARHPSAAHPAGTA